MRYNPSRDIPKAVRELQTLSPSKIANWIQLHRTETDGKTGRRKQKSITPKAISMYLGRHPKLKQQLERELHKEQLTAKVHSDALFENGTFKEIACIKEWIKKMRARGAKEQSINIMVNAIKQICMGVLPHNNKIEAWGLRHPQSLNMQDAIDYIAELQAKGLRKRRHRLALRNFFKSQNIEDYEEISGALEGAGKYADLFVPREQVYEILEDVKRSSYDAYLASFFAYKTGARITATLNADASYINRAEHKITVFEKAPTHQDKVPRIKYIPNDLWSLLEPRIEEGGKLFHIDEMALRTFLKSAFERVIPQLAKRIPMPFHFLRHMFAQHMLRKKEWNYSVVAKLGGWTTEALERYYGKMPFDTAVKLGKVEIDNL